MYLSTFIAVEYISLTFLGSPLVLQLGKCCSVRLTDEHGSFTSLEFKICILRSLTYAFIIAGGAL